MSTHRKIEFAIFIVAAIGFLLGVYFIIADLIGPLFLGLSLVYFLTAFFGISTFFAKLHVLHFFDGKRANQIVLIFSGASLLLLGYGAVIDTAAFVQGNLYFIFVINILLTILSLRLHKDFKKK